jgi:hypothetical protein
LIFGNSRSVHATFAAAAVYANGSLAGDTCQHAITTKLKRYFTINFDTIRCRDGFETTIPPEISALHLWRPTGVDAWFANYKKFLV